MGVLGFMAYWINEVPDHFKTQGSSIEAIEKCAWLLKYVPVHFKTQEMCNEAVRNHPYTLEYVPDKLKMQEMCDDAVCKDTWLLEYVPDWFKARGMCERAVKEDCDSLIHVRDWFVVAQEMRYIGYSHVAALEPWGHDDRAIKWYQSYKKRKAQKASIKEELIPIAWHPSRYWDWCMSEDEKQETEKLFLTT